MDRSYTKGVYKNILSPNNTALTKHRLFLITRFINQSPTKKMRLRGRQTASEVRSDLRFQIYGPNMLPYVCLDCFRLILNLDEEERKEVFGFTLRRS